MHDVETAAKYLCTDGDEVFLDDGVCIAAVEEKGEVAKMPKAWRGLQLHPRSTIDHTVTPQHKPRSRSNSVQPRRTCPEVPRTYHVDQMPETAD